MKSDKKGRGKSAKPPGPRSASSPEIKSVGGISSGGDHSISIQPQDIGLTRMLETLKPHDHLCLIYESKEEWRAAAVPFISIGLRQGEKCIYIVDTSTAEEIRKYLSEEGVDVASAEKSGQLSILDETETYSKEGFFDPERMIALLISETEKAVSEGYLVFRTIGEMTWVLRGHPGSERLLEYEAKLNRDFFPKYPCLAICQYDRWKFDPEIIKGVIMTHPLLVRGSRVYRNFYYVEPKEFLNEKRAEREVQHWLNNVEREQRLWAEVRESEESFRAVTENAQDGIIIAASSGAHLYANRRASEITGYSVEELLRINMKELAHPDEILKLSERLKKRLAGEDIPKQYETRIVYKEGKVVPIEVTAARTLWHGQAADLIILRDITERKRTEEALQQSEGKYKILAEQSIQGLIIIQNFRIVYANKALVEITGYTIEELLSLSPEEVMALVHPEDQALVWGRFRDRLAGKTVPSRYEYRGIKKDGSVTWLEMIASFIEYDGKPAVQGVIIDFSERKRAEEEMNAEKKRFQTLLENAPFGMVMIDKEGILKYINPKFKELFGYELTDVPDGKTWFRKAFPDPTYRHHVIGTWVKDFERFKPGEKLPRIFTATCKDGTEKIVNLISVLLETGEYLLVCEDITERKRAEEALHTSEAQLSNALKIAHLGHWEYDVASDLFTFSDHFYTIFRTTAEREGGHTMPSAQYAQRFVHPDDLSVVSAEIQKALETTDPHFSRQLEHRMIYADCEVGYIAVRFFIVKDDQGRTVKTYGVNQDITERKQVEETLKASEDRFRELYDNAPVGYHEVDNKGNITRVNHTELEMLGYSPEEVVGHPVWEFIPEEENTRQVFFSKISGKISPGRAYDRRFLKKDGTSLPVLSEDRLLRDEKGKITGIRVTIQDISERKRAEEEMAFLQEQLRQSQKIEAIGRLAGGIAHDFNNLLTIIQGNSQLSLTDLREEDPLRANIEEIKKASERAADLTKQLLAFSRKQIMEMKVLDLNLILQNLDKMLHRVLGEDIELVTILTEGIGKVKADPGQIEQVIINLAVNARDAMSDGGKLTIETANVELDEEYVRNHIAVTPGRYVMVSVGDTGVGMTPEVKERVFEPFFTTKEKGRGTGLGLSTVYGIVKQSGGNVWIYSESGEGTTFKIYLPQVDEPLDELKEEVVGEVPRGNETVLIVEDEEVVRKLAVRVLKRQGYKILEAPDGGKAFLLCEAFKDPIHLILTDVVMPGMSGRKLVDRLKEIHLEMKVLYMSGYTDNAVLHHGILEPGINFIQKPFNVDGLARKVREVLDK